MAILVLGMKSGASHVIEDKKYDTIKSLVDDITPRDALNKNWTVFQLRIPDVWGNDLVAILGSEIESVKYLGGKQ